MDVYLSRLAKNGIKLTSQSRNYVFDQLRSSVKYENLGKSLDRAVNIGMKAIIIGSLVGGFYALGKIVNETHNDSDNVLSLENRTTPFSQNR